MNNDPHAQALYRYTRWLATPRQPAAPPVDIGPHPLAAHIERVIGEDGMTDLDTHVRQTIEHLIREKLGAGLDRAATQIDACALLTVPEVMAQLRLTRPTVEQLYNLHPHLVVRMGRIVRIKPGELAALLEREPNPLEGPCRCRVAEMTGRRRAG